MIKLTTKNLKGDLFGGLTARIHPCTGSNNTVDTTS